MQQVNQVYQTNDYSLFSFLAGNRKTNPIHLERLRRSFLERVLFSPIIVNERYQIIDGQHRFLVSQTLSIPVNFIVMPGYGLREVQILNTNSSNWSRKDYLDGYCELGYAEYLRMRDFMKQYPDFSIMPAEILLTNTTGGSNNKQVLKADGAEGRVRNFENGDFEIFDLDLAKENAEKILEFKPFYDGYNRATFVNTMITLFKNPNYDHAVMIGKLKSNPTAMKHCGSISQYKEMIEEIYNFRNRNKVNLRF